MTLATKIIFIAALILSIIIPFGYYLIGEKNKKRYKRTIGGKRFLLLWRLRPRVHHDAWRTGRTGCGNSRFWIRSGGGARLYRRCPRNGALLCRRRYRSCKRGKRSSGRPQ